MDRDYTFSIITAFYNSELYIKNCIDSLLNQSFNFDDIQVILVDDGSTDSSADIALEYQERYSNVIVLSQSHKGQSSARNLGLKYATGKYVNFLDSDDELSNNALESVNDFFKKNDVNIIAIPIEFLGNDDEYLLSPKFSKTKIIDVFEDYTYPQADISSCFIKRNVFDSFSFDEELFIGEGALLINKILINEKRIAFINDCKYYYRIRVDESSVSDISRSHKNFFINKVNRFYKQLFDYSYDCLGFIPNFIKYVIAYDMQFYYRIQTSDVLTKQEFKEFRSNLHECLAYIDEDIIVNHIFIHNLIKSLLIYLKNNEFHIDVKGNEVFLKSKDYTINELHNELLICDVIEVIDNSLNISTFFKSCCDYDYLRIEAIKINSQGKEVYEGKFFSYPTTNRYPEESIGICWSFDYSVDFKIPLKKDEISKIYFKLIYDENGNHAEIHNPLQFQNYDAGLSKVCNYLIKDNEMVIYNSKDESFLTQPYSFTKALKLEFISILKIIKDHNSSMIQALLFHLIYLFLYPFMKNKRIWIFQDRVDSCDDNAMHLFKYAIKQDDDIEKYYVISKDCEDFNKMKKIDKNIVPIDSFKNKFIYLFAEKIISSHVNHSWLNPFFNPKHPYYNGFLTIEKCFLQHGVIKDDLSSWLRKFFQNLHLFLTSSDYERDSILSDTYNYDDEVVQAFGLPRHDNLKFNVEKKEILFSPTWRKFLINRVAFEKSDYYRRLNNFLTNERLLNAIKENGYKLVFKPHYDLKPFLDLFDINDDVIEVNTHDSYQTLFNDSALMITDYSSVFFDFAFLKKPVIYYHEGDDYHYDKGYFDYRTMGFGDVVENEDDLVDRIIEYMNNGCEMEEKYKSRVDNFFKYTDQKNCKRVYEWLYTN